MTATLEAPNLAAQAQTTTSVLVCDRTGGGLRGEYVARFCEELTASGVDIHTATRLRDDRNEPLVRRALSEILNLFALTWSILRTRAQVVVVQSGAPRRIDPLVVRTLHIFHKRVVWVAHEVARASEPQSAFPRAFKKLYKRVDAVVVFSTASADRILTTDPEFANRIWVIPYTSCSEMVEDPPSRGEARRRMGISGRVPVVVAYGDDHFDAGLLDFLDVIAELRLRRKQVEAVVAGDFGTQARAALDERIVQLGIADIVSVRTDIRSDESAVLFAAADAIAVPFREATDSMVPRLALAYRRPVVVTDLGGLAETVDSELKGEVARSGDVRSLADATQRLLFPRRRLEQRQWELARAEPSGLGWPDVIAAYLPALALVETTDGRRIGISERRKALAWTWGVVMTFTITIAIYAFLRGVSLDNPVSIAPLILPAGLLYLITVPLPAKVMIYVGALIFVELLNRFLVVFPAQLFMPALLGAAVLHLIIQAPKHPPKLKSTKFLHAVIILMAGWMIAEMFNPNVRDLLLGVRSIRLILEPIFLYAIVTSLVRDERVGRAYVNVFLIFAFFAAAWGLKIAFFGYFGFEATYIQLTGAGIALRENRNLGTMANPQTWGMFCSAIVLICLALFLQGKKAYRHQWFLWVLIPMCALNTVSSGQRIQFIALAVALPIIIFVAAGDSRTRMRSLAAIAAGVVLAALTWNWIPEDGGSRKGLANKTPIDAAREKLAALKSRDVSETAVDERLTNAGPTIDAVIQHPLGGGTGLRYVSKLTSGLNPVSSLSGAQGTALGAASDDETRARNIVPVRGGDYFYVDFAAEQGIPGLILVCMLFLTGVGWCLFAFVHLRHPFARAIAVATAAWMIALIVNSVTNGAFFAPQTSSIFFFLLALVVCLLAGERRDDPDEVTRRKAELDAYT